ncbi:MAG: ribonucleoside-diphosphate reductase, adenosylcobalamin-dependent, partial [Desulfobulbaceae bacterium]|nr:ribonucleoside-diphosphate reductase, adenosylcobalamin-dependent [Desulfobulbaceae bacterium]
MTVKLPEQKLTKTAETVLERRYYLKDANGVPFENWGKLCRRVADAVADVDRHSDDYETLREDYFQAIYSLDFLPNSPCLMNAGTDLGQLSACFVLPVEDSMDGIFTSIRNGALVHKTGGGTGYSFSRLRSKNSSVRSTQGVASGPLSFAAVFDAATETIKQGGKRRGANMGVLRIDHPDIEDFIHAKQDQNSFTNFNFSVAITDAFMEAVKNDTTYDLIDPSLNIKVESLEARRVFDQIIDLAWHNGEPGVLFIDAANKVNTTPQLGQFEATNPCGEQWLLPYESCNLGSINLGRYVT